MRYQILEPIEAKDNLATLFNAYVRPLSILEQVALPRETIAEYRQMIAQGASGTLRKDQQHRLTFSVPHLYHLVVLDNSLHDLHANVLWAIGALSTFFTTYAGDLRAYAIAERMACIEEYGSDDPTDWEADGFDEQGEKWKVTYKNDEQSLAPYSLNHKIKQFFTGDEARGEKIGTSQAEDYDYFSSQVARASDFNPLKLVRKFTGAELPVYQQNEAGEMVQRTLGEEVERELNEDLRNQSIVAYFRQVLRACNHAAALQCFATRTEHYQELLTHLETIRDVSFPVEA